ncbi:hypothetical protein AB0J74_35550 [Asanoa sp. NPDC049573]
MDDEENSACAGAQPRRPDVVVAIAYHPFILLAIDSTTSARELTPPYAR